MVCGSTCGASLAGREPARAPWCDSAVDPCRWPGCDPGRNIRPAPGDGPRADLQRSREKAGRNIPPNLAGRTLDDARHLGEAREAIGGGRIGRGHGPDSSPPPRISLLSAATPDHAWPGKDCCALVSAPGAGRGGRGSTAWIWLRRGYTAPKSKRPALVRLA